MKIAEFRQQYPEYNNLDDATLTDALYNKFYSEQMSFDDFSGRFNAQVEQPESKVEAFAKNTLPSIQTTVPGQGLLGAMGNAAARRAFEIPQDIKQAGPIFTAGRNSKLLNQALEFEQSDDPFKVPTSPFIGGGFLGGGAVSPDDKLMYDYKRADDATRAQMREQWSAQSDVRQSPSYVEAEQAKTENSARFPVDAKYNDSLPVQVAGAAPDLAAFMVTAPVGGGVGLLANTATRGAIPAARAFTAGATAAGATLGGGLNAVGQFNEAIDKGATLEQAYKMSEWGAAIGLSEVVPILKFLDKFGEAADSRVKKAIYNSVSQALAEGTQEAAAQLANNLAAIGVYDAERDVLSGVKDGFQVGGVLGGIMGLVTGVGGRKTKSADTNKEQTAPEQTTFNGDDKGNNVPAQVAKRGAALQGDDVQAGNTPTGEPTNERLQFNQQLDGIAYASKAGRDERFENLKQQLAEKAKNARGEFDEVKELQALRDTTESQSTRNLLDARIAQLTQNKKLKPKLTPEEKAAKRTAVDLDKDDLITALRKKGGLDVSQGEASDFAGRLKSVQRNGFGLPSIEQDGSGLSLDQAAEWATEQGYINYGEDGRVDLSQLHDALQRAESGEDVMSMYGKGIEPQEQAARALSTNDINDALNEAAEIDAGAVLPVDEATAQTVEPTLSSDERVEDKAPTLEDDTQAEEPKVELEQEASEPAPELDDFGEKLEGARKDLARTLETELTVDEIKGSTLSKLWPKKQVDDIEDVETAAIAYAFRQQIPAKPRRKHLVDRWANQVSSVRRAAAIALSPKFQEKARAAGGSVSAVMEKVDILKNIDRSQWGRIGDVFVQDPQADEGSTYISVMVDGRRKVFVDDEGGLDGARKQMMESLTSELSEEKPQSQLKFEIRYNPTSGAAYIVKTGDREKRRLMTFESVEEARKFKQDNHEALVAEWELVKERDNVTKADMRNKDNAPRVGKDYRNGEDVTPELFQEKFGFRGVQFGNWIKQGRGQSDRQGALNEAYDSLLDLAEVLDVPTKAISLNGSLGLAFGARGKGKASAHYEPGNLVINLTKTKGAGSLAHEWFHALDNYFSRLRGGESPIKAGALDAQKDYRQNNFITYKPEPGYVYSKRPSTPVSKAYLENTIVREGAREGTYADRNAWIKDPKHPEGVRPQVEEKFARLVDALNDSPMKSRSARNDKAGDDGYWSRIIERGARAFENYVIAKLEDKGARNDYLANVRKPDEFSRNEDRYPYLLDEELAPIKEAFDALFETVESKETESGVALFQRKAVDAGSVRPTVEAIEALVEEFRGNFPRAAFDINIVSTESGLPTHVLAAAREQGADGQLYAVHDAGTIHIVADKMQSETDVKKALFHEVLGHGSARAFHGGEIGKVYNKIFLALRGENGIAKIAKDNDLKNFDLYLETARGMSRTNQKASFLVDELLAHLQENNAVETLPETAKRFIKELYGAIRQWMRDNGFAELANYNDSDLAALLKEYRKVGMDKNASGGIAFQAAYHGTPHTWEGNKPSLGRIGEGEGMQAYGWGLYFAGNREVAEHYRDAITASKKNKIDGVKPKWDYSGVDGLGDLAGAILRGANGDLVKAISSAEKKLKDSKRRAQLRRQAGSEVTGDKAVNLVQEALNQLVDFDPSRIERGEGNLYQADIPEDGELLDWDKPLSEQPDRVKNALRDNPEYRNSVHGGQYDLMSPDQPITGGQFYSILTGSNGFGTDRAASHALNEAGIKGLRYLDANSRDKGEGHHNYVIWDEDVITVEAVNDQAIERDVAFSRSALTEQEAQERKQAEAKGLPMDKASRMERARAMGFDTEQVWYHGTKSPNLRALSYDRLSDGLGFYLTKKRRVAEKFASQDRNVLEMLVRMPPEDLIAGTEKSPAGDWFQLNYDGLARELRNKGYKAAWVKDEGGSSLSVIELSRIRSVNAAFDPEFSDSPNLMFSRRIPEGAEQALNKAGLVTSRVGVRQAAKDFWDGKGEKYNRFVTGIADVFNPLKELGMEDYVDARMSTNTGTMTAAALGYATPEFTETGVLQAKADSKGLMQILEPLADQLDAWAGWMAGKRAEHLKRRGKENNFSDEDIAELLKLADGQEELFESVAKGWRDYNVAMLEMMRDSGLLSDRQVTSLKADRYYIPFYRETDEAVGGAEPYIRAGLSGQKAPVKTMKGGRSALKDPIRNMIHNVSSAIDASVKNRALRNIVERNEGGLDIVETDLPASGRKDVISVTIDGEQKKYQVADLELAKALIGIRGQEPSAMMKLLGIPKRFLTTMITAEPTFMLRNMFRDTMSTHIIGEKGTNAYRNVFKGLKAAQIMDKDTVNLMMAGGTFMGGYDFNGSSEDTAKAIRKQLKSMGYSAKETGFYMDSLPGGEAWRRWREVGEVAENANRIAYYKQMLEKGYDPREAAFKAKDVMDFSLTGNSEVLKFFTGTVPFLNARIQGLYKLGRTGLDKDSYQQFLLRGLTLTAASMALWYANQDEEEYQDLPEWDKDANWHFFIGGEHLRIPKPFEIGLIYGTMPERIGQVIFGEDTGEEFAKRMWWNLRHTLEIDPIPQAVKPLLEAKNNRNTFRDAPIENLADQGVLAEFRYNERTSTVMREIGQMVGLSPKMLEHVWKGYTGSLGAHFLAGTDWLLRAAMGEERPAMREQDYPVLGWFWRGDGPSRTKYGTEFYDLYRELDQTYKSLKKVAPEDRADFVREHRGDFAKAKYMRKVQAELSKLRKRQQAIYGSKVLTPEQKRERLDRIQVIQNKLQKQAVERVG